MIELMPVFEVLIGFLIAALTAFGAYALKKLGDKFGVDAESALADRLQDGLDWAIEFAEQRLHEQGKKYTIETERELVANAVNYVIDKFPVILAHFGITEEGLVERIEARLNRKEYNL